MLAPYDFEIMFVLYTLLLIPWVVAMVELYKTDVTNISAYGKFLGWWWYNRLFRIVLVYLFISIVLQELGAINTGRWTPILWVLWCIPGLRFRWRYQSLQIVNKEISK